MYVLYMYLSIYIYTVFRNWNQSVTRVTWGFYVDHLLVHHGTWICSMCLHVPPKKEMLRAVHSTMRIQ